MREDLMIDGSPVTISDDVDFGISYPIEFGPSLLTNADMSPTASTTGYDFEAYIHSLELRHFEPGEFLVGMERGNYEPPVYLWSNIALTAVLVDRLRHHFRRRTTITSAYRAPTYNRAVGGVQRSQHCAFSALDVSVRGVEPITAADWLREQRGSLIRLPVTVERVRYQSPAGWVPFAPVETWKNTVDESSLMKFAGGIGVYPWGVHLDSRGENRSWSGSG